MCARLQVNEGGEAFNIVAVRSDLVMNSVDFDEANLVAVLGLELVDYLVPRGHELHAVAALRHEKVNYDNRITTS